MPEVGAATAIGRASTATDDSPWIGEARVRGPAGGAGGRGRREGPAGREEGREGGPAKSESLFSHNPIHGLVTLDSNRWEAVGRSTTPDPRSVSGQIRCGEAETDA